MAEPDVLLDSDVLIEILRGAPKAETWLSSHIDWVLGIPVIARMEILQGARDKQEQQSLIHELREFQVVYLKDGDTERAMSWFEAFNLSHNVGIMDCLIATAAVRLNRPLYTFNLKHYRPIKQLLAQAPYSR